MRSDEKKTSHCKSRALFTKKAPTKNMPIELGNFHSDVHERI